MKVILLDELKGKGREGDVVDVARGFAVNYLLPNKLALEASKGNLKQLEARRTNIARREDARVAEAHGLAGSMAGKMVTISAKAGGEGRLFGSVTPAMIVDAVAEQLDVTVDKRRLEAHGLIKTVGDHVVTLRVYHGINTELTVRVVGEGVEGEQPVAAVAPVAEPEAAETAEAVETEPEAAESE